MRRSGGAEACIASGMPRRCFDVRPMRLSAVSLPSSPTIKSRMQAMQARKHQQCELPFQWLALGFRSWCAENHKHVCGDGSLEGWSGERQNFVSCRLGDGPKAENLPDQERLAY